jgi:hypothetical protein
MKHSQMLESTTLVAKQKDSELKHNEEHGGMLYKYDLPIENSPILFKS